MKAKITIEMDNAAFENPGDELGRILEVLAKRVRSGADYAAAMDLNGNRVGELVVSDE